MADPKERPSRQRAILSPQAIGTSGLRHSSGYVTDEFLPALAGAKANKVYREMSDNDGICGAIIFLFSTLVRQVGWTVQAADDSPEGESAKEFVEGVFADMSHSWDAFMSEVCSMFVYGHAPMEILWKRRVGPDQQDGARRSAYTDNLWGIRAISLRAQPTISNWEIHPDGSIAGFYQQPFTGPQVFIPIEKALLFRTSEEKNNPLGRSVLRTAYRPWYFKKRLEEIEAVGVERDLAGMPVVKIPGSYMAEGAGSAERQVLDAYKAMIRSIRRDTHEGIVMPSTRDAHGNLLFELSLLSTGGGRQIDTSRIITRYDQQIASSVLADFLLLGQRSAGSFALSSDKTELFATALGTFLGAIANTINQHLLPRLWRYNGMDPAIQPSMRPGDIERQDLGALGAFLTAMTGAGATLFPDRELENHLRAQAGLPEAAEDGGGDDLPRGDGLEGADRMEEDGGA